MRAEPARAPEAVTRLPRPALWVLVLLNVVVLLGQLWPAGAPPFARAVNIAFLVASLAYFVAAALRGRGDA